MIVSTNAFPFTSTTTDNSGVLTNTGYGAPATFLTFKPAAWCKKQGYLYIKVTGSIYLPTQGMDVTLNMQFNSSGYISFPVTIINNEFVPLGVNYFSAETHIPVGAGLLSESSPVIVSTMYARSTNVIASDAFISNEPDLVFSASFTYNLTGNNNPPVALNAITVRNIVAEYKENGIH